MMTDYDEYHLLFDNAELDEEAIEKSIRVVNEVGIEYIDSNAFAYFQRENPDFFVQSLFADLKDLLHEECEINGFEFCVGYRESFSPCVVFETGEPVVVVGDFFFQHMIFACLALMRCSCCQDDERAQLGKLLVRATSRIQTDRTARWFPEWFYPLAGKMGDAFPKAIQVYFGVVVFALLHEVAHVVQGPEKAVGAEAEYEADKAACKMYAHLLPKIDCINTVDGIHDVDWAPLFLVDLLNLCDCVKELDKPGSVAYGGNRASTILRRGKVRNALSALYDEGPNKLYQTLKAEIDRVFLASLPAYQAENNVVHE